MTTYYPSCGENETSISDALSKIGVDSSKANRKKIAEMNGFPNYVGLEDENIALLNLLKKGKLIKSKGASSNTNSNANFSMNQSNSEMTNNISKSDQFDKKTNAMVIIGNILFNNGYEPAFVAGILANIYHEGNFGFFESSKYVKNPAAKPNYLKIMDEKYDYANKYSGKCVTEVNLKDLKILYDKIKNNKSEKAGFGLGIIQWTYDRTGTLIDLYLEEANGAEKITINQVISAEGKMVMKELRSNQYKSIYDNWKTKNGNNLLSENAAYDAGSQICLKYEVPYDKENQAKKRGNTAKKVFNIMMGN